MATDLKCAGCGKAIRNEGVTNNDNTGLLWCSRECRERTATAPYHPAPRPTPVGQYRRRVR